MLLIVPSLLDALMLLVGTVSFLIFFLLIYRLVIGPVLLSASDLRSPPPREGFTFEILMDDSNRRKKITIGQSDSLINTRMSGIKEDHLSLEFIKEKGMEEYLINVSFHGPLQFLRPHAKKLDTVKEIESFESRELIGYPAVFRLGALVKNNRFLQYVEFELSTKFFIDKTGAERMKFFLTLKKVFPSVKIDSRNKRGVYMFGRLSVESEDSDA